MNRLVPKLVNKIKTKAQMFHQKLSPPKTNLRWAVDDLRARASASVTRAHHFGKPVGEMEKG